MDGKYIIILIIKQALCHAYCLSIAYFPGPKKYSAAKAIKNKIEEPVGENFADGKKKGKSRPGRVKKSGASCNGTVTQLRKRAKNASGEKAKMYHWCANMKGGKK